MVLENRVVDQLVGVLGIAGSITTAISLAALSLLIAFLLSKKWLQGKNAAVEKAISGADNEALARILGGTSVPLESLSPDQKYSLAEKELRTRALLRLSGYALTFFAFIGLLGFASLLAIHKTSPPESDPAKPSFANVDLIDAFDILSKIQKEQRQEVCAKLMSAEQCSRSKALLNDLAYQTPAPEQKHLISVVEKQGGVTADQLRDLAACGGSFRFRVDRELLVCQDGTPLPLLNGPKSDFLAKVQALVFHSTATSDNSFDTVSELLTNGRPDMKGPLAHLLVSRSGAVIQFIPFNRRAWHVGMGHPWNGTSVQNSNSIGVQMINQGADSHEPFTAQQVEAAKGIARAIRDAYGIDVIVGHSEVASPPGRKTDPGPLFPLSAIRSAAGVPEENK